MKTTKTAAKLTLSKATLKRLTSLTVQTGIKAGPTNGGVATNCGNDGRNIG